MAGNIGHTGLGVAAKLDVMVLLAVLAGKLVGPEVFRVGRMRPEIHPLFQINGARYKSERVGKFFFLLVGHPRVTLAVQLVLLDGIQLVRVDNIVPAFRFHMDTAGAVAGLTTNAQFNLPACPLAAVLVTIDTETGGVAPVAGGVTGLGFGHLFGFLRTAVRGAIYNPPYVIERFDDPVFVLNNPSHGGGIIRITHLGIKVLVPVAAEDVGDLIGLVIGRIVFVDQGKGENVTLPIQFDRWRYFHLGFIRAVDFNIGVADFNIVEVGGDNRRSDVAMHIGLPRLLP